MQRAHRARATGLSCTPSGPRKNEGRATRQGAGAFAESSPAEKILVIKLGNTGATIWQVLVDNTAPDINVTQPVASAYYSVVVPAAVTARLEVAPDRQQ
jgi:hypothetical protein